MTFPAPTTAAAPNDNRRAPRAGRLREGRCVFNNGSSSLTVFVRNISSTGAKLTGGELIRLPDVFELQIHDGFGAFASRFVKRVWSSPDSVGVAFTDAAQPGSTVPGPLGR